MYSFSVYAAQRVCIFYCVYSAKLVGYTPDCLIITRAKSRWIFRYTTLRKKWHFPLHSWEYLVLPSLDVTIRQSGGLYTIVPIFLLSLLLLLFHIIIFYQPFTSLMYNGRLRSEIVPQGLALFLRMQEM